MKKIILISTAILACFTLSAQTVTRSCLVTLKGSPSGTPDELQIYEVVEATTTEFFSSMEATHLEQNTLPTSVNIYAEQYYKNQSTQEFKWNQLSAVALPDITGMPIIVMPNEKETQYSFTFADVVGEIKVEDRLLDSIFVATADFVYNFTMKAVKTPIKDRFRIYKPTNFKVCTTFDHVEIYDNEGTDNIVITNMAGDTVVNVDPVAVYQSINLSEEDAGHYILTVNGKQYEFCNKPVKNN